MSAFLGSRIMRDSVTCFSHSRYQSQDKAFGALTLLAGHHNITTSTPHHSIFTGRILFWRSTDSVKALKATKQLNLNTHTHLTALFRVSRYQKGKTNLDFTEASDSEWQWHQLGHMQVCTSLQTDNHASTPPHKFFTGRMPFLPPNQQRQSTEGTN